MSDSGVSDVDGMLYNLRSYQEYVVSCRECGFYLFRARRIIVDERYWRCFIITVSFVNRMNKKNISWNKKKYLFTAQRHIQPPDKYVAVQPLLGKFIKRRSSRKGYRVPPTKSVLHFVAGHQPKYGNILPLVLPLANSKNLEIHAFLIHSN